MGKYRGQKTLSRGPNKPRKFSKKFPQKVQVAVSNLFSTDVTGFCLFSTPWRFRSQFLAQKLIPALPTLSGAGFRRMCLLNYN